MPDKPEPGGKRAGRTTDPIGSHLRGVPIRDIGRLTAYLEVGAGGPEMAILVHLRKVLKQATGELYWRGRQRTTRPGRPPDTNALINLLEFLLERRLPLRTGGTSAAVVAYAEELARTEPKLRNPAATARSRLLRLTDLRRRLGYQYPTTRRPAER
jgi:hypothetical protein